ncbi:YfhO family protein [bacterium]|nr:YfhO family protein [bacterium]
MRKNAPYFLLILLLVLIFFYKVFQGNVLLPADLSLRLQPWRSYSFSLFPEFRKVYNPLLDVILYFYPWRVLLEKSLKEGYIPLWSSYNFSGQPFLANMASACLYPFNWLLLFIQAHWLMTISIIFHFLITGIFAFLFFSSLGLKRSSALLGAIIWTFSGPMVAWAEYQTPIASMSWFPLMLFCFRTFIIKRKYIYALLAGFPLALSILGGHTQFALYGWLAFTFFAIFQSIIEKNFKEGFIGLFISLSTGFVLSLPQLLPSFELAQRSHRSLGSSFSDLSSTAMPLGHLWTFLVPNFFGNPVDYDYRGAFNYVELCGYFGLLPFFLAPFALTRKEGKFFLFLALVALLFSLKTPLLRILTFLPIFSYLAAPARSLFIVSFSFAALASFGFDRLKEIPPKVPLYIACILLLLLGLGISLNAETIGFPSSFALISFLILTTLSSIFLKLKKVFPVVLLSIIDMFAFGIRFNPAISPAMLFPSTPATERLSSLPSKEYRFLALPGVKDPLDTLLPNCNILLGLREIQGGDSLYPLRVLRFAQLINKNQKRSNALYITNPFSFLLDIAGIKYIFSRKPLKNSKFSAVYEGVFYLYENKSAFPRFYLSAETINFQKERSALKALPILNKRKDALILEGGIALHRGMPSYSVNIEKEREGFVRLRVKCDRESYLLMNETFYPGWKAFVDGKEEKILPANYLFQSVHLAPGEHEVVFAYRPTSFKIGLYLALLGISSIVAFLYIEGKRRIRSMAKRA